MVAGSALPKYAHHAGWVGGVGIGGERAGGSPRRIADSDGVDDVFEPLHPDQRGDRITFKECRQSGACQHGFDTVGNPRAGRPQPHATPTSSKHVAGYFTTLIAGAHIAPAGSFKQRV